MQLVSELDRFPVQWHEGMLLSPQHFQQEQRYQERLLGNTVAMAVPHFWGLSELNYNQRMLPQGILRIDSIKGLMPDGHMIDIDHMLEVDLSKNDDLVRPGDTIMIYLAMPKRSPDAAYRNANIRRFESTTGNAVVDENTGENAIVVQRLRPQYHLHLGPTPPPNSCIYLQIMQVRKENSGDLVCAAYTPPLRYFKRPDIPSSKALYERFSVIVRGIRQKAIRLAAIAASSSSGLSHPDRVNKHRIAKVLGSVLPSLESALADEVHPNSVYKEFTAAVGHLSQISTNPVPPPIEPYDHDDIEKSLRDIFGFLTGLLAAIDTEFRYIRFELNDTLFSLALPAKLNNTLLTLEVRGDRGTTREQLVDFISSAKIVCESKFKSLDTARRLGANRRILDKPLYHDDNDYEVVVVQLSAKDDFIRTGERLLIQSATNHSDNSSPASIWLAATHRF